MLSYEIVCNKCRKTIGKIVNGKFTTNLLVFQKSNFVCVECPCGRMNSFSAVLEDEQRNENVKSVVVEEEKPVEEIKEEAEPTKKRRKKQKE